MNLVDTSVWIEFLRGHEPYRGTMRKLLTEARVLASDPVFGELLQGARAPREREVVTGYWNSVPRADLLHPLVQAGEYASSNKLLTHGVGLIDASLIVTAKSMQARIWTLDRKLLRFLEKHEPELVHDP